MTDLGLSLLGEQKIVSEQETTEPQTLALDTFESDDQPLPLDLFGSQQSELAGGSTVEQNDVGSLTDVEDRSVLGQIADLPAEIGEEFRSIKKEFTDIIDDKSKDTTLFQELRAPVTEVVPSLATGMANFMFVKPTLLGASNLMTVLENVGLKEKTSAKSKQDLRNQIEEQVTTLGGLIEPKTKTGEVGMKAVEVAFRPIINFVESRLSSLGVDEEMKAQYPNVTDALQFGGELLAFGALPKIKNRIKKIEKTKNPVTLERRMNDLLKDAEQNMVKNPKLVSIVKEYQDAIVKSKKREQALPAKLAEFRENVRKFGKLAEQSGKDMKTFLKENGFSKKEIRQIIKVSDAVKQANPAKAPLEVPKKAANDFDFFNLKPGEQQVNVGTRTNKANPNIKIGPSDSKIIHEIPRTGRSLRDFIRPTEFMMDKYPSLRPLLNQAREVSATVKKELTTHSKHLEDLRSEFPEQKLREELGVHWHNLSESGAHAMNKLGHKAVENPRYLELKNQLEPLFKDLFVRINEARTKLGKRKIPEMENYLAFFSKESMLTDFMNLVKGKKFDRQSNSLVMDSLDNIAARQGTRAKDSTAFHHLRRQGLEKGVKLELDPIAIYGKYLNESVRHMHISPLNAFVKELINVEHLDPQTGKTIPPINKINPELARDLSSWNNKMAGVSNVPIPRSLEKVITGAMTNLTAAQLFAQVRTVAVQPVALALTSAKHGVRNTTQGILDMMQGKKAPVKKSNVLPTAELEAGLAEMNNIIETSKFGRGKQKVYQATSLPLRKVDYWAREATWRTVWNGLKDQVKSGKLSEREAIRIADAEVIRSQGSGEVGEISPIQRNALGKASTLWQTHNINQLNFVLSDILGIGGEKVGKKVRAQRLGRTLVGTALINALFEQVGGIQSPLPSPEQTLYKGLREGEPASDLTLKTFLELAEAFPFGGSAKFGSHPAGPLVDLSGKITEALARDGYDSQSVVSKALQGDERSRLLVMEIIGKLAGIPGTAQTTKYIKARKRGEPVPFALLGRYQEGNTGSKSTKRTRRKRRRSKRKRN